jgi:hypothetical protein
MWGKKNGTALRNANAATVSIPTHYRPKHSLLSHFYFLISKLLLATFYLSVIWLRRLLNFKVLYIIVFILLHVNSWDEIRIPPLSLIAKFLFAVAATHSAVWFITTYKPQRLLLQPIRFL